MDTVSITFDPTLDAYRVKFPYDPGLLEILKRDIPSSGRRWEPSVKAWLISSAYAARAEGIISAYYPGTIWPRANPKTKATEIRLLAVHYLGQCKERTPGEITATALLQDGQWGAIFPYETLIAWFENGSQSDFTTLYSVLGVKGGATQDEIKSGFRRMARQWHPDVCSEPNAQEIFIRIKDAYEILSDPSKKARYDVGLTLEASMKKVRNIRLQDGGYRSPLRCGYVMAEGTNVMGRFVVSRILGWEDITDDRGRVLVTSWPFGADKPVMTWA